MFPYTISDAYIYIYLGEYNLRSVVCNFNLLCSSTLPGITISKSGLPSITGLNYRSRPPLMGKGNIVFKVYWREGVTATA